MRRCSAVRSANRMQWNPLGKLGIPLGSLSRRRRRNLVLVVACILPCLLPIHKAVSVSVVLLQTHARSNQDMSDIMWCSVASTCPAGSSITTIPRCTTDVSSQADLKLDTFQLIAFSISFSLCLSLSASQIFVAVYLSQWIRHAPHLALIRTSFSSTSRSRSSKWSQWSRLRSGSAARSAAKSRATTGEEELRQYLPEQLPELLLWLL